MPPTNVKPPVGAFHVHVVFKRNSFLNLHLSEEAKNTLLNNIGNSLSHFQVEDVYGSIHIVNMEYDYISIYALEEPEPEPDIPFG